MKSKNVGGRPAKPLRTKINIVQMKDGKAKHLFSLTVLRTPNEVMKVVQEAFWEDRVK